MKILGLILVFISFSAFAEQVNIDVLQTLKLQCQMDSNCEIEYFNQRQNQQRPIVQFSISNGTNTLYVYKTNNGYIDVSPNLNEQIRAQQNQQQQISN